MWPFVYAMCFVREQRDPFVYLTSLESVTSEDSRGEISIILFQLAYTFITSERGGHLSESL